MNADLATTDWYTGMTDDAAFLGDFEAEERRFGHEARLPIGPMNIGSAMRTMLDGNERARGMSMAAFMDCLIEGRPYCLMQRPGTFQVAKAA